MKTSVRLFWWLVLLFAASLAITVVSWLAGELVGGGDRALDNMLESTLTVAFVIAIVSGLLLMFIAPGVFHNRFQQTRTPPGGTMSRR
jgi:hypothetical protein